MNGLALSGYSPYNRKTFPANKMFELIVRATAGSFAATEDFCRRLRAGQEVSGYPCMGGKLAKNLSVPQNVYEKTVC